MRNLLLILLLACAAALPATAKAPPLPPDSLYQLQATLTDQDGRRFAWAQRRGAPQLVAMFYTSCQYICPLIVEGARRVERELTPAERAKLRVLLITLDPARDDVARLRQVMTERKLDARRWTLARTEPADLRPLAALLGVRYRGRADGEFDHTGTLVLLDGEGRVVATTAKLGSVADPEFTAAVRRTLANRSQVAAATSR